jgi:hypothetical protein
VTVTYGGTVICSLYGYPVVHFVNATGQQVGMVALDEPEHPLSHMPVYLYPKGDSADHMKLNS